MCTDTQSLLMFKILLQKQPFLKPYFFSVVKCGRVPLPELAPATCNLTIWHGISDVTHQRINVLEGDTINIVCDARCTNEHYTPVLRWINPREMIVWDVPGRYGYIDHALRGPKWYQSRALKMPSRSKALDTVFCRIEESCLKCVKKDSPAISSET